MENHNEIKKIDGQIRDAETKLETLLLDVSDTRHRIRNLKKKKEKIESLYQQIQQEAAEVEEEDDLPYRKENGDQART